ncbi:hypothetical protein K1719_030883 [Acacia pycnantha]|nr:hypothetical protein K1719_030883 [Acacia pycnantha]
MRSDLKGEKYINSNVVEDDLEGQSKQGSFTQSGKMGILATTIGKLDHPSFVRGEPSEIGFSRCCGRTSQRCGECECCRVFVTKVKEKVLQSFREELLPKIHDEIRSMMSSSIQVGTGQEKHRSQESSSFSSSKGSYNPPELGHGDLSPTPKVGDVSM